MKRLFINKLFRFSNIKNNPYELLGVANAATQQDIKSAYYKLAKQYHPDLKPEYADKFKEINEAYNILKDPIKRTDYDNLLNRSKDKQNVSQVHQSHYNTNFHYGYTKKTRQQQGPRYDSNPFAHQYEKRFSNEFTRNMFRADNEMQRGKNIRNRSNTVRNITIGFFCVFLIFFSAEVMVKIYAFNRIQQKSIVYERLDPREESRGLVD